ncbi:MAG: hypothetical protein U1G05_06705 [Kiritimatiellia bacterium]
MAVALQQGLTEPSEAQDVRAIVLEKSMTSAPAVGVAPLYVHKPDLRRRITDLLDQEKAMVADEAVLAGMLAGYDRLTTPWKPGAPNDFDPYVLHLLYQFQKAWYWAADFWSQINPVLGYNPRYAAYRALRELNRRINLLAVERQALEKAYFDELAGSVPTNSTAKAEVFFDQGVEVRRMILNGLRERIDSLRLYRRETLEDFLLAQRRARDTGVPFADTEKAVEWWSVDNSRLNALEAEQKELKQRQRTCRETIETYRAMLNVMPTGTVQRTQIQMLLDGAAAALKAAKTRQGEVDTMIKNAQLGYDPDATGGKVVRPESDSAVKSAANTFSVLYADLATRRRILQRATRESTHLHGVAAEFDAYREKTMLALQKLGALHPDRVKGAYDPLPLRGALLDKGIVNLSTGEMKVEDGMVAESDYFYSVMDKYKNFGGKLQTSSTAVNTERVVVEGLQISMELCSAMASAYGNVANDLMEAAMNLPLGVVGARMNIAGVLEKTYNKIRNKRIATDKKITLLADALDPKIGAAELRQMFGIGPAPIPQPFAMFYASNSHFFPPAEHTKAPLELFRLDSEFYRGTEGGLRGILISEHSSTTNLLAEAYVIACEKAAYTLRELTLTAYSRKGLDATTGGFNWKLLTAPVQLVIQTWEALAIHVIGRDRDYVAHNAKRAAEHAAMLDLYPHLVKAGFDARKVAEWIGDPAMHPHLRRHWELLRESPEYRRFWFRAEKIHQEEKIEEATDRLKKAMDAFRERDLGGGLPPHIEDLGNRVQAIGLLGESEAFLAPAHYQDAIDKAYQFSFEDTVDSLLTANELDPSVVSMADIRRIEEGLFALQTRKASIDLVVSITDEIVWDYLLGKITEGVMGRIDGFLGLEKPGELAKAMSVKDMALAAGAKVKETLVNKFNPFASSIPIGDLYTKGVINFMSTHGVKMFVKNQKNMLRDTVLVQSMGMDPDWADKLFDFVWTVGSGTASKIVFDKYKVHETGLYRYASMLYLKWQLDELSLRLRGTAMTSDLASVLGDESRCSFSLWKWIARRRAQVVIQAMTLGSEMSKLQETLEKEAAANPGVITPEMKQHAIDLARARMKAFHESTPLDANLVITVVAGMDFGPNAGALSTSGAGITALARKLLHGEATREEVDAASQEAVRLFAVFGPSRLKALRKMLGDDEAWPGGKKNPQRRAVLVGLDAARRTIHLQSLNYLADLAGNDTDEGRESRAEILKRAAKIWDEQYRDKDGKVDEAKKKGDKRRPKFESMAPDEIKNLVSQIAAVVPTGSAGYVDEETGEYRMVHSDLDYTVLMRDGSGVTADQRLALESILRASFRFNSGGFNEDAFDVSFMVDREGVFRQTDVFSRNPAATLAEIEDESTDPEKLRKLNDSIDSTLREMSADYAHPERYVTNGRKASLVFQAALGQDILIFDPAAKSFQIRKKTAIIKDPGGALVQMPENIARLVTSQGVKLEDWMALGTVVDDVAFLSTKMKKINEQMQNTSPDVNPYDAIAKELSKRCIRVMLAYQATDPDSRAALNAKMEKALMGEKVDQGDICNIMATQLAAALKTKEGNPQEQRRLMEMINTVQSWKKVKLGEANADEIVEMVAGKKLSQGSPEYRAALQKFTQYSVGAMEEMAVASIHESVQALKPMVEAKKRLDAQILAFGDPNTDEGRRKLDQMTPEEKKKWETLTLRSISAERLLQVSLNPIAARFDKLNNYQFGAPPATGPSAVQKALLEGLQVGISKEAFEERKRIIKDSTTRLYRARGILLHLEIAVAWPADQPELQEAA